MAKACLEPIADRCSTVIVSKKSYALKEAFMRRLLASVLLAVSILAHGFWRAGNRLHHVFGGILVMLVAVVTLPISVVRYARRRFNNEAKSKDE